MTTTSEIPTFPVTEGTPYSPQRTDEFRRGQAVLDAFVAFRENTSLPTYDDADAAVGLDNPCDLCQDTCVSTRTRVAEQIQVDGNGLAEFRIGMHSRLGELLSDIKAYDQLGAKL